ncbi:NADPH-dependent FMN reductase [Arcticibacter svalbardensis MN12-7]|uniref:NADPH-dependent FMN reductase n=1 Tax=Arcticibacter svalbardensis MN12-7 TaxID=1150600 RepID=R9GMB4_9SPHI|nr:NADPH-dependent FMN reductase [Arcticibacter svalbardensis]EOR92982.1 NADPH-dependent FMN reductase [Arcticibacter svalbardensis MN12-7]
MITIIASTNRTNSYSLKTAQYYQKVIKQMDHDASILSLENLPEDIIHTDMYGKIKPRSFEPFQQIITNTQKFIFIIPEYNGSFPGILKVMIDTCRFPDSFSGKKACLVGISTGKYGNIRGIDHFTGICHYLNMHVLPLKIHIPNINKEFDEEGNFFQADTLKFTKQQISQFIAW